MSKEKRQVTVGVRVFTVLFPDLFRPLNATELQGLTKDIEAKGVQDPITVDEQDGIIDGGHRATIAASLGLAEIPVVVRAGLSDEEKLALANSLNLHRRQLSAAEQKKHRAERVERVKARRKQGASLRTIAEEEKVSHEQVRLDLQSSGVNPLTPEENNTSHVNDDSGVKGLTPEIEEPNVSGKDGKQYKATKEDKAKIKLEEKKQKLLDSGKIPESVARQISSLPIAEQEEILQKYAGPGRPKKARPDTQEASVDDDGVPLPEVAIPAFEHRADVTELVKDLGDLIRRVKDLSTSPAGAYVHINSVVVYLDNAKNTLHQNKPGYVCPYCQGQNPSCSACAGRGWVTKRAWKAGKEAVG